MKRTRFTDEQIIGSGRRKMQEEFGQDLVIKAYQRAIKEIVSQPR